MGEKLTNLIESSVKLNKCFEGKDITDKDVENVFKAVIDKTTKEIYDEIKTEIKNKAIEEAKEEIRNQTLIHKIKELKKLTVIGIVIAFFIGIIVNQTTGLFTFIAFFKNWYGMLIVLLVAIIFMIIIIFLFIFKEEKK